MIIRVLCLFFFINSAHAGLFDTFFETNNQKAQTLIQKGQYKQAAELFSDANWQASANYRAGNYEKAAKSFHQLQDNDAPYNEGNALAHLGQYEKAIEAYNRALSLDPTNKDAKFNRDLLQTLLEQQKKQQQQQQQQQQQTKSDESKSKDQKKSSQDKQEQAKKNDKNDQKTQPPATKQQKAQQTKAQEKKLAKQQWLNLIPDDPGGLLREKFLRDHYRRLHGWNQ